ncbi:MAG TPA: serine hydrolase [Candidatus Koribacter sp.]|jgi:CubicO group peptidase (beta-lactamase class C family)
MRRLLVFLLLSLPALAQNTQRMDEIVRSYTDTHKFMGSVLVAKDDHVIFQKSYGYANLEWQTPNVDDGKYRLGSITKQFTAVCILLLEEQGKLSTSDPVNKYYAEAPASWDKITLRNLLTHTSGIHSFTSLPKYSELEPLPTTPEKELALIRDLPLDFEPGTKWDYSNTNFILLGYIVEKVSGMSFTDFLQQNVLAKLGMTNSGMDTRDPILEHRVYGYTPGPKGIQNAGYIDMSVPHGAGAMYSTTGDLLKWTQGLFGGHLLQPTSLTKMTTPFLNDYAFGLNVMTTKSGHKVIQHGGGIEGFNTELAYYPDDHLTVVALANLNGSAVGEIAHDLAAVYFNEKVVLPTERKALSVPPSTLQQYVGEYAGGMASITLTVTLDGDQLYIQLTGQPKFAALPFADPESPNSFFFKEVDGELQFIKDSAGKFTKAVLHQGGRDVEWLRK